MYKPFSQACENNKAPILAVLKRAFSRSRSVLEIGSGTGQHAVYFAHNLPFLDWQPSDLPENLEGIRAWCTEAQLSNLKPPIEFDVNKQFRRGDRPGHQYDGVFTANSLHIMGKTEVERFFSGLSEWVTQRADLCIYGPFNYNGRYTSDSNARFDQWLADRDARSAIRDFEWVHELAQTAGFALVADHEMPANNRLLHWTHRSE